MTKLYDDNFDVLQPLERPHRWLWLTSKNDATGTVEISLHGSRRGKSSSSAVLARQFRILWRFLRQLICGLDGCEGARFQLASQPDHLNAQRPDDLLREGQAEGVIADFYVVDATRPI